MRASKPMLRPDSLGASHALSGPDMHLADRESAKTPPLSSTLLPDQPLRLLRPRVASKYSVQQRLVVADPVSTRRGLATSEADRRHAVPGGSRAPGTIRRRFQYRASHTAHIGTHRS
eukprot:521547-Rhodomonas_salina.1